MIHFISGQVEHSDAVVFAPVGISPSGLLSVISGLFAGFGKIAGVCGVNVQEKSCASFQLGDAMSVQVYQHASLILVIDIIS